MYACLHTPTPELSRLLDVARAFTPRFEMVGTFVMLDARGLSRIFGEAVELARHLYAAACEAVPAAHVAVASTQTSAALLALGRPGLTMAPPGQEAAVLAALRLDVLGAYERLQIDSRAGRHDDAARGREDWRSALRGSHTHGESPHADGKSRTANREWRTANGEPRAIGWRHPRDTHQAQNARARRRTVTAAMRSEEAGIEEAVRVLHRWGVHTLGTLAALPGDDLSERLGPRGPRWQRLARGEDWRPLVPWVEEPPYEAALDLEWPIEGLEPLSFVLGRLLEPLAARLERDARGAAGLYTRLRLVSREVHTRVLQLPAPMRDPKALRTLMLLDLESHPPAAAIDRVAVAIDPTPGRVVQESLFTRAAPPPEQVATLVARLGALMGAGHVGRAKVVDTWEPGAFAIAEFRLQGADPQSNDVDLHSAISTLNCAVRRFRLPVPVRVRVIEGRPVRVTSDRHGVTGGAIVQCAGPWRASGEWWMGGQVGRVGQVGQVGRVGQVGQVGRVGQVGQVGRVGQVGQVGQVGSGPHPPDQPDQPDQPHPPYQPHPPSHPYDRDEWDVVMADGTVYRLYVERQVGQWFIEGVID